MANRFGRNQRRKMREQIYAAQSDVNRLNKAVVEANVRADRLAKRIENWASDIAQLLGPTSAYNERPMSVHLEDVRHLGGVMRMEPMRMAELTQPDSQISEFATIIDLAVHTAEISKESRDRMSEEMRIKIESRHGNIAYAINQDRAKNWSPCDITCMAEMIANRMAFAS